MFKSLHACQVGTIKLLNTDVLSSSCFVAIKLNKMMCDMCLYFWQDKQKRNSFYFHISAQEALMGSAYVVCHTGRKIAVQGNGNANVNNCGRTSAQRCDVGAIWHLLMRPCNDGLVWNGFLTRLRAARWRLTDSVSWELLMVFPMHTRPHVRFSVQTACLVLQESLWSIAMILVFMVAESVCVICGSEGSSNRLYST